MSAVSADNYRYWQEEGSSWPAEYDDRKFYQPDVHIQEAMLATYMSECAPAKVLEYGCGFGRHLSYLRDVTGIDIHGYDQSPTMLGELEKRFDKKWFKEHVTLGAPVGRVPYEDGAFDIAYTAEVLVHVRPDDVRTIIKELMRISRWHVLHIEPSAEVKIVSNAHDGCWKHDLVAIYRDLGYKCEILPSIYSSHDVFRVMLDENRKAYTWSPVVARLLRRANLDLRKGLGDRDEKVASTTETLAQTQDKASALVRSENALKIRVSELEAALHQSQTRLHAQTRANESVRKRHDTIMDAVSAALPDTPDNDVDAKLVAQRIRDLRVEVDYVKRQQSYRAAKRLRGSKLYDRARWLKNRNAAIVEVKALGRHSAKSEGDEVWILAAREAENESAVPWDFFETVDGEWKRRAEFGAPFGEYLQSPGHGTVRVPLGGTAPQLKLLKHRWSGLCEISWRGHSATVDLYDADSSTVLVRCTDAGIVLDGTSEAPKASPARSSSQSSHIDRARIAELSKNKPAALAVHTPRWLGVSSATRSLFTDCYEFPRRQVDDPTRVDEAIVSEHARALVDTGVRHFVFSGGDMAHLALMNELKKLDASVRADLLWHASYVQCTEDYTWKLFQAWVDAARDGRVAKIGAVKKGMEKFFSSLGAKSEFVMNYVDRIPERASTPDEGGPHVGVWLSGESYRKLPYAMLAAVKLAEPATLRTSNLSARSFDFIRFCEIETTEQHRGPLSHEKLMESMAKTHASLYVTFSECAPMLPLESFSVGVPCLLGANSHIFEDDKVLREACVVDYADRADKIHEKLEAAIANRVALVERYRKFAVDYNKKAKASVVSFLS